MNRQSTVATNDRHTSEVSRRGFLLQTALGATAVMGGVRPALAKAAPNDRLGVAVIGAGGIGRFHGSRLGPLCDMRVVCEVDRVRGEMFRNDYAPQAELLHDYREVLTRPDIDAVFVCTPDHWHAKIAIEALHAGKHVYCEKPLTLTIEEGQLIESAVEATGQVMQIGTQQRSSPDFQTAVALAHDGRIGRIKRVTAAIGAAPVGGPFPTTQIPDELDWERWLGPAPMAHYCPQRCHGNFRWWYEYSGGKMSDWGAHHVDIALWAAASGETRIVAIDPLKVVHQPPLVDGMPSTPDHFNTAATFHVRCRLANGVELDIRDSAPELGFENGILFEGEEGRYFVNRGKLTGRPVEELSDRPLPEGAMESLRHGQPVRPHLDNFFYACRGEGTPMSDVNSHVLHLNTCHAANIAMRLGQPLEWNPATRTFGDPALTEHWVSRQNRDGYQINV